MLYYSVLLQIPVELAPAFYRLHPFAARGHQVLAGAFEPYRLVPLNVRADDPLRHPLTLRAGDELLAVGNLEDLFRGRFAFVAKIFVNWHVVFQ